MKDDLYFMKKAYLEALKAYQEDEVPIGCVIVQNDKIIARAHNTREKNNDVFGHAEILAIKKASKKLNTWKLDDVIIYITCESCLMCTGAIYQARIKRVVYGVSEPKFGCLNSLINFNNLALNHKIEIESGIYSEEIEKLMKDFFKNLRNKKEQTSN